MDINNMREYVQNAYPGDKWKARVACMHKNQVIAIYNSLQSRDRDKKKKDPNGGKQLTIFDF